MPGVALFGITGRMGQAVLRALREPGTSAIAPPGSSHTAAECAPGSPGSGAAAAPPASRLYLSGALASPSSSRLGRDAALEGGPTGVLVSSDPEEALEAAAVAIDFSLPQCIATHARACLERRVPLLVGATGLPAEARAELETAARALPVLIAPNTSVGIAVLAHVLGLAAAALGEGYDVEISEAHHRMKRDAPSGTALALGEAVAQARGASFSQVAVFDRAVAAGPRRAGSIGFAVTRAGDIVGEHTVTFAAAGERLEMIHRAADRMVFARGALRAAEWLIGRPPGLYGMRHVLGL